VESSAVSFAHEASQAVVDSGRCPMQAGPSLAMRRLKTTQATGSEYVFGRGKSMGKTGGLTSPDSKPAMKSIAGRGRFEVVGDAAETMIRIVTSIIVNPHPTCAIEL
jgi:hypothetical protein